MRLLDRLLAFVRRRVEKPVPFVAAAPQVQPNYEVLYGQEDGRLRRLWRKMTIFPQKPVVLAPLGAPQRIPRDHPTTKVPIGGRPTIQVPIDAEPNTPQPITLDVTRKEKLK